MVRMDEKVLPWNDALEITNVRYMPPKKIRIAGIDGVVVDPHNEVFSYWWNFFNEKPAVVIHVDKHDDMAAWAKTQDHLSKGGEISLEDYSSKLAIDDFISTAMFYGKIGPVFHIDPRKDYVDAYGGIKEGELSHPELVDSFGTIKWKGIHDKRAIPKPTKLSYEQFIEQLKWYKGPIILDTDLDAFECKDDPEYCDSWRIDNKTLLEMVLNPPNVPRLQKVVNLLANIPKPQLITIARSLTGSMGFVPHYRVDALEFGTIMAYSRLYNRNLSDAPFL